MLKTLYVCEQCHFFSDEEFWSCRNCKEDKSKVLHVSIKQYDNSFAFSFYDKETTYENCYDIVKNYLSHYEIKYVSMYSKHNFQLETSYFEVVVKLS